MTLPVLISIIATILFGIAAVIFSVREEKVKKLLLERGEKQKHRIYEITVLKEIQDRIGYELDIERIIDVITESLKNLFSYSTASSLLLKEDRLVFKTYVEEGVNHTFIERIKKNMLASLTQLVVGALPEKIDESLSGALLDDNNPQSVNSFFNIPLIINNNIVGLISISSTKANLYKEEEMTVIYKITEQASNAVSRLQAVLTTEKGKLMAMIGSLTDGIFMVDLNNQILVINPAAKKLFNLQVENPTLIDIIGTLPKGNNFISRIEEAISLNKTLEEKEIQIGNYTIQAIIIPVFDRNLNKPIGASVLLHDLTLEKNLAKMKEEFTNIIVHELRAPLTSIRGASDLMEKADGSLDINEQKKLLRIIHEQSQRLLSEVSSILDAAKLEEGRFTIYKAQTDLQPMLEKAIDMFTPQAKAKNITLTKEIAENLPKVNLDTLRIEQVINNLLSNSLKFTLAGGKIKVLAKPNDSQSVTISVSDTGIGIPKEKQEQLFTKFAQINHPASEFKYLTSGSGLGLYIVKGIVEAHGGTISLQSGIGQGTTISFILPI